MTRILKPYKKYMIVWMDILGFKNRVEKFRNNFRETTKIAKTLENAKQFAEEVSRAYRVVGIKSRVLSDNIMISCPKPDTNAVSALVVLSSLYQVYMISKGYFLRGAAVIDGFYSKDKVSFGPVIIRAIQMEKVAV